MDIPILRCALLVTILPLLGALIAGLLGSRLGKKSTHTIVITLIAGAFFGACYLFKAMVINDVAAEDGTFYTWATAGMMHFDIAFLVDRLSATMAMIVLFVSLAVHVYTIGYMADDPGYTRFFSYVALFTFAMLVLIFANNFLLLFFGWEGVGLVSYLLIGFWFQRDSAAAGSLKAFLVNRLGDIGFILGTALVLMLFGTLSYHEVFAHAPEFANKTISILPHYSVPALTFIAILFLIGALAKSAQVPMHVWLPESMEGPTPISALIHAATMVTAGIYMVARMSPIFEYSPTALSLLLILGGTTALFLGLVAVVQNDIKRVIAYSTISQLGYMAVALGASAYDVAIFHLITHAFFKALLFLAAGSVIIALHHEQDMRKMGGLASYLPVTYLTFVIGTLALCAIPPFSGFYSKDMIIEAANLSQMPGARYAYYCVLIGAFVTPLYMFRALFLTFHTDSRVPKALAGNIQESPWVVLIPLIALAIPSIIAGEILIGPMLFANTKILGNTTFVLPAHEVLPELGQHYHGAKIMALQAGTSLTFWLSMAGILTAWAFVATFPQWSEMLKRRFALVYAILVNKFGFDAFNQVVFVQGTRDTGRFFYEVSDVKLIDGVMVNGSGRGIKYIAQIAKRLQTGYLYQYALVMMLGIAACLVWYIGGF